jgi:hypothetical protein
MIPFPLAALANPGGPLPKGGTMRLRHVVLILAALLTTAPAISAGEGRQEKTYKSPQEVFDAAKEAAAKDDWKGLLGCTTPKTQDMLTGMLVLLGSQMENLALAAATKGSKDKNEERDAFMRKLLKTMFEPIHKVYARHGLTDKVLKDLGGSELFAPDKGQPDPEKLKEAFAKAARLVKDKAGFVDDFMKEMAKLARTFGKGEDKGPIEIFGKNPRLEDLKIEGDTAKGMIVSTKRGREQREPMYFKKGARGWLLEPPIDELTNKSKKSESKEKGARAPAGARDALGSAAPWAGRMLTACRAEGLHCLAFEPRQRLAL